MVRTHPALDEPLARDAPTDANAVVWALGMICEHERIHLETSTTLIRELPLEFVTRPQHWSFDHASAWQRSAGEAVAEAPQLRRVAGGQVTLGAPLPAPALLPTGRSSLSPPPACCLSLSSLSS